MFQSVHLINIIKELVQLLSRELARGAATEVDGFYLPHAFWGCIRWACLPLGSREAHFLAKRIDILLTQLAVGRRVEPAVDASALAEGNVNIESCHGSAKVQKIFIIICCVIFFSYFCGMKQLEGSRNTMILNLIRDTIRDAEPTAQIILYGSRARGDARKDSDWDVLAIVDKPKLTFEEKGNIEYPIWDKGLDLGEQINVFSYTKEQWESAPPTMFKYNVKNEGIVL